MITVLELTQVSQRVKHTVQDLLTLPEHLRSPVFLAFFFLDLYISMLCFVYCCALVWSFIYLSCVLRLFCYLWVGMSIQYFSALSCFFMNKQYDTYLVNVSIFWILFLPVHMTMLIATAFCSVLHFMELTGLTMAW